MSEFTTEFTDQFGVVWRGTAVARDRMADAAVGREPTVVRRPMRTFEVRLHDRARWHRGWFRRAVALSTDWWVQPVIPRQPCECTRCRCVRARG